MNEGAQSVLVLELERELVDYWSGELWGLGATAIEERDGSTPGNPEGNPQVQLVACFSNSQAVNAVRQQIESRVAVREEQVAPVDWTQEWKKHFKPTLVSPRIFVCPSWSIIEPPAGAQLIIMDAGPAFGSGTHETTQLALQAIDRYLQDGMRVYDVGTGSGILAIAAAKLGAAHVDANDIDSSAVDYANENLELNGVVDRVSVSTALLDQVSAEYDLVIANIQLDVLQLLQPQLWNLVKPGGMLLLTGLLSDQSAAIHAAYQRWMPVAEEELRGWILVALRKEREA